MTVVMILFGIYFVACWIALLGVCGVIDIDDWF